METNDTCFCKESFIDILFLVFEIQRGYKVPTWLHKPRKLMVNRVNINTVTYVTIVYRLVYNITIKTELLF